MSLKPGDTVVIYFNTVNPSTGVIQNADSAPTATMEHNGADDGSVTLTVTNVTTGRYKVTGTIPSSGYASGDKIAVRVNATVNSLAGECFPLQTVLDGERVSDLASTMASDFTSLQSHGDAAWATATGFATSSQASAIETQTNKIGTNSGDSSNAVTAQGNAATAATAAASAASSAASAASSASSAASSAATAATQATAAATALGSAGAGLTGLPPVTLASSQPDYAPATVADLAAASLPAITGTVTDATTPSTTQFTASVSSMPLVGQLVTWNGSTANPGQCLAISAVTGNTSAALITVESGKAFSSAPSVGDTFIIAGQIT